MTRVIATLLLLSACGGDRSGTAVGNPGSNLVPTVEPGASIDTLSGEASLSTVAWVDCAGGLQQTQQDVAVDLVAGTALPAPSGTWCGVDVGFDGAASFVGTGSGRAFDLALALGTLSVRGEAFDVAEPDQLLRIGGEGWIDLALAGGSGELVVRPGGVEHDDLVASVLAGTVLVEDADGDGRVSAGEAVRASSVVAPADTGGGPGDDTDDDDGDDDTDDL